MNQRDQEWVRGRCPAWALASGLREDELEGPAGAAVSAMRPLDRVLETILYVDDLEAAERFYGGPLGLALDSRKEGLFAFFRIGDAMLLLFEPGAARRSRGVPAHGAAGPGHACFAVAEDELDGWKGRLEAGRGS